MKLLWFLSTLAASALAADFAPPSLRMLTSPNNLFRRQGCDVGYKVCGSGCIQSTWTCCPDLAGGCASTENCQLGNNGKYGCCPKGETCNGGGGAITTGGGCNSGFKTCGIYCITASYQCCPDLQGGCNVATATCLSKAVGGYGCCALTASGRCSGAAGLTSSNYVAATTTRNTIVLTSSYAGVTTTPTTTANAVASSLSASLSSYSASLSSRLSVISASAASVASAASRATGTATAVATGSTSDANRAFGGIFAMILSCLFGGLAFFL